MRSARASCTGVSAPRRAPWYSIATGCASSVRAVEAALRGAGVE